MSNTVLFFGFIIVKAYSFVWSDISQQIVEVETCVYWDHHVTVCTIEGQDVFFLMDENSSVIIYAIYPSPKPNELEMLFSFLKDRTRLLSIKLGSGNLEIKGKTVQSRGIVNNY